jgi:hypothetical protein
VAISKTETAITTAMKSSQAAIDTARESAGAKVTDVDNKSAMRHDAAITATNAVELKLGERMQALQQLIDVRARMNEVAVEKANEANEKRFESVNEFRSTLSDQAREFVTTPVLNAKSQQLETQLNALAREFRTGYEAIQGTINGLSTRLTTREATENTKRDVRTSDHMTIGNVWTIIGGVVALVAVGTTVIVNLPHTNPNPLVGENTRRVDDLNARLNDLSNQLGNRAQPPR